MSNFVGIFNTEVIFLNVFYGVLLFLFYFILFLFIIYLFIYLFERNYTMNLLVSSWLAACLPALRACQALLGYLMPG